MTLVYIKQWTMIMAIDYVKQGKIAIFTINRPEARNALDIQANREFSEAMADFSDDPNLWVGIVTGAGDKAFCSGADVKDIPIFLKEHPEREAMPRTHWRGLELWKPLIAAINGVALGGGLEVALGCDIRIASENAKLGFPEVKIGIVPGAGGVYRLTRALPWCKAAEILFTGKIVDAQEAYRIGLVNQVTPPADLMLAAKEWAQMICESAPLAVRAIKEVMFRSSNATLEEGLRLEWSANRYLMNTEDSGEGHKAFSEKRKPVFKGK
jgi:enoyl-CoA hydratase/carnithine racemase